MKLNLKITTLIAALVLGAIAPVAAFADTITIHANLTATAEVPPKDSSGHGQLSGTYDTSSKQLQWHVVYDGLNGQATMAHFHGPAPAGKNAGVVIPIRADKLASPIDGRASLTDVQATDLLDGKWYFNVHTAENPGGEIRGQVAVSKQ
jgi:hypothetical protein